MNKELAEMQRLWRADAQERGLKGELLESYVREQEIKYRETKTGRYLPGVREVTSGSDLGVMSTPESRAAAVKASEEGH